MSDHPFFAVGVPTSAADDIFLRTHDRFQAAAHPKFAIEAIPNGNHFLHKEASARPLTAHEPWRYINFGRVSARVQMGVLRPI